MQTFGALLVIVGAVGVYFALCMNTAVHVSSEVPPVHNLGLLALQIAWTIVCGLTAVSGVIVYCFGILGAEFQEWERENESEES